MFFWLSKVLWFLVHPGTVLVLAVVGVAVLSGTAAWPRWGRVGVRGVAVLALALAVLPVGTFLLVNLENRFPVESDLPSRVDGIVVLGGVVDPAVTRSRGRLALSGSVERLTEAAALARRYPDARIVFTGGSGDIFNPELREADLLGPFIAALGLDPARVVMEREARNTYQNATLTKALVAPAAGETWLLVTSAFHMPRAVGCFRRVGWDVVPYPVDFMFEADEGFAPTFDISSGIGHLNGGLHEWAGLLIYWLIDRTDALFPGPQLPVARTETVWHK